MKSSPVTTQRPMQQARAEGVAVRPVLYRLGFSISHDSSLRAALKCLASFSAAMASWVKTFLNSATSAARAGSVGGLKGVL